MSDFLETEERKTAMSHDEMQDYWKTLCSFTGEDIPNEINQLMTKIHYPRFLYKYRAVNNNKSYSRSLESFSSHEQ